MQVPGDVFVFGDGDCGQLGLGEEVTERLRPFPLSVENKKVGRDWGGLPFEGSNGFPLCPSICKRLPPM